MFLFLLDGNRDLDDPTDRTHARSVSGTGDVGAAALTLDVFLFRMVCGNYIWGFQHPQASGAGTSARQLKTLGRR